MVRLGFCTAGNAAYFKVLHPRDTGRKDGGSWQLPQVPVLVTLVATAIFPTRTTCGRVAIF